MSSCSCALSEAVFCKAPYKDCNTRSSFCTSLWFFAAKPDIAGTDSADEDAGGTDLPDADAGAELTGADIGDADTAGTPTSAALKEAPVFVLSKDKEESPCTVVLRGAQETKTTIKSKNATAGTAEKAHRTAFRAYEYIELYNLRYRINSSKTVGKAS